MAREKKISFRYFLNMRLQPLIVNGTEQYPVYIKITFNRKQTEIKCFVKEGHDLYWDEAGLNDFLNRKEYGNIKGIEKLIVKNENILRKIIKGRYKSQKDRFSFKEISKELEFYREPIISILYQSALNLLDSELKVILDSKKYEVVERAGLTDKYFAATALSVGLKQQLSHSLISLLQAISSFEAFLSPYPYTNGQNSNTKLSSVDTWYSEEGKEKYAQFVEKLSQDDEIWANIIDKSHVNDYMRLLSEFKDDFKRENKLEEVIDNQLLAKRPR